MNTNTKYRICAVLGGKDNPLKVGEEWRSAGNDIASYRINEDGHLEFSMPRHGGEPSGKWIISDIYHLTYFIEHPELIVRKPRFTEDELATMRVLYREGVNSIYRESKGGDLCWRMKGGLRNFLPDNLFPSILPGQCVNIAEVLSISIKEKASQ